MSRITFTTHNPWGALPVEGDHIQRGAAQQGMAAGQSTDSLNLPLNYDLNHVNHMQAAISQKINSSANNAPHIAALSPTETEPKLRSGGMLAGLFSWHGNTPQNASPAYLSRYREGQAFWEANPYIATAAGLALGGGAGFLGKLALRQLLKFADKIHLDAVHSVGRKVELIKTQAKVPYQFTPTHASLSITPKNVGVSAVGTPPLPTAVNFR